MALPSVISTRTEAETVDICCVNAKETVGQGH